MSLLNNQNQMQKKNDINFLVHQNTERLQVYSTSLSNNKKEACHIPKTPTVGDKQT